MNRTLTWLHLSDLHARQRDDWDSRQITDAMVRDLKVMQKEHGIRPDLVFFTGDIAYGSVNGEKMEDQYQKARTFLDAVRRAFDPEVPIRDIYLVPGNHDVDRGEITPDQTEWLRHPDRKLSDIIDAIREGKKQWRAWLDRLASYRNFITKYGLLHLQPDDSHLIWADEREIAGVRVGIAGLNSAWSCADKHDKGRIWCGTDWQISQLRQRMGPVDFSFALIHHPGNWFTDREDPVSMRRLRQAFTVVLHGHEHQEWVEADVDGNLVLSAGACYQSSWMANGYNFGHLDLVQFKGSVRLRQWDATGGGWVSRNVASKTQDGVWSLGELSWLRKSDIEKMATSSEPAPVANDQQPKPGESVEQHYTRRFCQHVIDQHDVLELFGCDIPRELQRHQLSVAYVSLNLASEREVENQGDVLVDKSPSLGGPEIKFEEEDVEAKSASIEQVLDSVSKAAGRLLIWGPAGAGKSTLLRWCAIHAAQCVVNEPWLLNYAVFDPCNPKALQDQSRFKDESSIIGLRSWRGKVPILIRLRDCPSGRLPAANDLPRFLAKHLPSAPIEWMTGLLDTGRVLVLFDGVDEVHRDKRSKLAEEIGELIRTYPQCTYVVTTRPGAVERGWLSRLEFTEVRVEPMSRGDREEFIEKWYRSAALELKQRPRPGEDLAQTAARLKVELADQPELGVLATNPLLCAMICALYRERQERLPETPPELCEALCHMLLHRRERETPGLEEVYFVATWRALQYAQKKGLLADLAWHMVSSGESSIDYDVATSLVANGLASTPGRIEGEASEVLQALVERSGLLRPATDDRIDFLHNTLKEYLAAGVVVEGSDWKSIASRADDPAWQPVILFALSLAPEQFSSALVKHLLDRVSALVPKELSKSLKKSSNLTRTEREALTEVKARQFFLVRCRAAAKRLAAKLSTAIDAIAQRILPPMSMSEAEALAQVGPRVLLYSEGNLGNGKWWAKQTCPMSVRCLRLLRRIGGSRARAAVMAIHRLPSNSSQLTAEWMLACNELCPDVELPWPFEEKINVPLANTHVSDLRSLAGLASIQILDLGRTRVKDIGPLAELISLRKLELYGTEVSDLGPLARLISLQNLSLSTVASDLGPLAGLTSLTNLYLQSPHARNLGPLAGLTSLTSLSLFEMPVSDLGPLAGLTSLTSLFLYGLPVKDLGPLAGLTSLTKVSLGMQVNSLGPLTGLASLQHLNLYGMQISGLGSMAGLTSLTTLSLRGAQVTDLSPLARLTLLQRLSLWGTRVSNFGPLAGLTSLHTLQLEGVQARGLGPLAGLTSLRTLWLEGAQMRDLSPLVGLTSLQELNLDRIEVSELGPVVGLTQLRVLTLRRTHVSDLARFRQLRPEVAVYVYNT